MQLIYVIGNLTGLNHKRKQCGQNKHLLENLYISSSVYESLKQNLLQNDNEMNSNAVQSKIYLFPEISQHLSHNNFYIIDIGNRNEPSQEYMKHSHESLL